MTDSESSLRLLQTGTKEERAKAAAFLGGCGTVGIDTVTPLLTSQDWHLRYRAGEILGLTGESSAIPLLIPLLKDEKDHVRYIAVKSIGKCGGKAMTEELRPLLDDENHFVRRITREVLEIKE